MERKNRKWINNLVQYCGTKTGELVGYRWPGLITTPLSAGPWGSSSNLTNNILTSQKSHVLLRCLSICGARCITGATKSILRRVPQGQLYCLQLESCKRQPLILTTATTVHQVLLGWVLPFITGMFFLTLNECICLLTSFFRRGLWCI